MVEKVRVGVRTLTTVMDLLKQMGVEQDLAASLEKAGAGLRIAADGSVQSSGSDVPQDFGSDLPGKFGEKMPQNFGLSESVVVDSASLDALQRLIEEKGLDAQSPLLAKVKAARPPDCGPPYDCGDTILF